VKAAQAIAFAALSFGSQILWAGCDPYDELRCRHGYDWVNCRCLGEGAPLPPAAIEPRRDMTSRARQDPRFGAPVEGSDRETPGWHPDWELRSAVFHFNRGRQVMMYHVTYKGNRSVRYTIYFDPDAQQWTGWR
jgi:hypothetical protein